MKRALVLLLVVVPAIAAEPWQSVLIIDEDEPVNGLLDRCEWRGTVEATGRVAQLARAIAEEALKLGANAVQITRTESTASIAGARAVVIGRAFLCPLKPPESTDQARGGHP